MRGTTTRQATMLSALTSESLILLDHPIRRIKPVVEAVLAELAPEFDALYARTGRPRVPPEHLLKATVLMAVYSNPRIVSPVTEHVVRGWGRPWSGTSATMSGWHAHKEPPTAETCRQRRISVPQYSPWHNGLQMAGWNMLAQGSALIARAAF
jgi:hypothetical protein